VPPRTKRPGGSRGKDQEAWRGKKGGVRRGPSASDRLRRVQDEKTGLKKANMSAREPRGLEKKNKGKPDGRETTSAERV